MERLLGVIRKVWGFETLRPLQREAMEAALGGRDSLVVLPTGGGKSLCYQAPALLSDRLTVVVSPLIALMKDQVDGLRRRGIPGAFLNSSQGPAERGRVEEGIARGEYKLVFVSPERFSSPAFDRALSPGRVGSFAIDEAHSISHWGHDFRPDYRALGRLKREFPRASVHAFTATATERTREDIIEQLGLADPVVLVGDFFRPNLRYRVLRRRDAIEDVLAEVRRRPGQPGIVYAIRRNDVEGLARGLKGSGIRAAPYHAGMEDRERTRTQDRFARGEIEVVVATVAFGMGIDRADIRFVLHAAMPRSIEHYQQETGRDGKAADCVLYYSGQDYGVWKSILENQETGDLENKLRLLSQMYRFTTGSRCRHRALVEYFGQRWKGAGCGACDVCTEAREAMAGSGEIARAILTGVVKTGQRYGAAYLAEVLSGEATPRVLGRGGDRGPVFGMLAPRPKRAVLGWIEQLVDQGALRPEGEYGVLRLTERGSRVLRSVEGAALYEVGVDRRNSRTPRRRPR